jgi:ankyrin repeat protein
MKGTSSQMLIPMIRRISETVAALLLTAGLSSICQAQESEEQQLIDAARTGQLGKVQSLLNKKISPKIKDKDGRTPLHLAVIGGHQTIGEALLRSGAEINALDNQQRTPLDLAEAAGHSGLAQFLQSRGGKKTQGVAASKPDSEKPSPSDSDPDAPRTVNPSLKFKTAEEFEKEIGQPAVLLDSDNLCLFAPKKREKEARIVFRSLIKAYDALYQTVGVHTKHKIAVCVYPKGNPHGWGGTSECKIEYDDSNLDLSQQQEWMRYKVPHVSGFIEEMAHNFVGTTKAQFGWEMVGWSIGAKVSSQVAGNPIWAASLRATREGQKRTYGQYMKNGCVFPAELPPNQCDRIHAWILYRASLKHGPRFWPDFFREIRSQKQALDDAGKLGDADKCRNARYQITIDCFDRLPGLNFKNTLKAAGISLTTDVKSLHPESPGWNRRLSE